MGSLILHVPPTPTPSTLTAGLGPGEGTGLSGGEMRAPVYTARESDVSTQPGSRLTPNPGPFYQVVLLVCRENKYL